MEFDKPLIEEIDREYIIEGDVITIHRYIDKEFQHEYITKYINGKFMCVNDIICYINVDLPKDFMINDNFIPSYPIKKEIHTTLGTFKYYRHNYKFISKNSLYDKNTECYIDVNDWNYDDATFYGFMSDLWDEHYDIFENYIIKDRTNQERTRKLLRIIN